MTRLRVVLTLLAVTTTMPPALLGQTCGDNDPATPVPECRHQNNGNQVPCSDPNAVRLWPAGLRPGLPGQTLPPERDSTQWTSTTIPGAFSGHELFHGLDILGNKLYVAYNAGFQIWDIASGPHAEQPSRELTKDGWRGDFLDFPSFGENDFYVDDIDVVTAGGKNLIALSGRVTVGLSVWEHTIAPLGLVQKYQDLGNRSQRVRVVDQGGINYAFAGGQLGIFVYDLNAAQALASPCLDLNGAVCPGVYRGKLGETNLSLFLDAIKRDGHVYVAKSGGNGVPVEIWEVTTPSSPGTAVRRFQGLSSGGQGLAFFEKNTIPYLGVVEKVGSGWRLRAYNVDACLDTNGCGSLGSPLIDRALSVSASSPQFLNFSSSGSTPFLYYGANEFGLEGSKVEQLLDLSNFPGSVSEITDSGGTYHDTCNGETVDYWGDYYPHNDKGLRNIRPMVGKFKGNYFYRAAFGVLDVHVLEAQEPTIDLAGPPEGFPGEPQAFQASASGCTPSPTYNWSAPGGSIAGTGANVNITWSTPGTKTVTVTNSGCPGAQGQRTIDIVDPAAMVGSVTMVPAAPRVCDQILFTANDVTGQDPIIDAWTITRSSDSVVVASGPGSNHSFPWNTSTPPSPLPGGYTAEITVSNGAGSDSAQRVFTLAAASLSFDGGPTYEGAPGARGAGTSVQFFASASGDSAWSWDFDDPGSGGSNTSSAENPTHTFATPGTYDVTLQISSCDAGVPPISDTVTIEIIDNPLEIISFSASCQFGPCDFCVGETVFFGLDYLGDPEVFSYDWDGSGNFDQNSPNPINSHTYNEVLSNFFPRARISANGEEDIFTHIAAINVNNCGPPPTPVITVSGPTTREVGQAGTYSGSAQNCAPAANGWSWSASGGGAVTGNTSSSEVSISWPTTGTKTVTASNSSCGTATGSLNVSVSGPSIAIAGPTSRLVDQPGDYNASAENCSPVANGWHWNATGGGNITGDTSSNAVTVTWTTAGTKTLTATNDGCSGAQGTRSVSVTTSGGGVNAAFSYSPQSPGAGESVSFNGSGSTGNIGSYFWSFGGGGSASGPVVSHTFAEEGTYIVHLTVAEPGCANLQCEDTASQSVVVGGDGPPLSTDEMLILPYFVVDTFAAPGAGLTTFFAIRNETDEPVTLRTDYFGAADTEPFHSDQGTLAPHSAAPINIRVISGLPFDEETGLSEGYVLASVIGLEGGVRTISGDVFYVDDPNDFANGGNMLTPAVPDLCSQWSVRFFNGLGFDGGTEIQFYAPGNPGEGVVIVGDVYAEDGTFMTRIEIDNPAIAFSMTAEELELPVDSVGGIEWQFQGGIQGHVAYVLKALGKFSVGGPAICRDAGF
jgi:PKD repeat protein